MDKDKDSFNEIVIYKKINSCDNTTITVKDIFNYIKDNNIEGCESSFHKFLELYIKSFEEMEDVTSYIYSYFEFLNCFIKGLNKNRKDCLINYNIIYNAIINFDCCFDKSTYELSVNPKNPIYLLNMYLQHFNSFRATNNLLDIEYLLPDYLSVEGQRFYLNQLEFNIKNLKKSFIEFINNLQTAILKSNKEKIQHLNPQNGDIVNKCIDFKNQLILNNDSNKKECKITVGIIGKLTNGIQLYNILWHLKNMEQIDLTLNEYTFCNETIQNTLVQNDEDSYIYDLENKHDLEQIILENDIVIFQNHSNFYEKIIKDRDASINRKQKAIDLIIEHIEGIFKEREYLLVDNNINNRDFDIFRNYYKILADLNELTVKELDMSYEYNPLILKNLELIFKDKNNVILKDKNKLKASPKTVWVNTFPSNVTTNYFLYQTQVTNNLETAQLYFNNFDNLYSKAHTSNNIITSEINSNLNNLSWMASINKMPSQIKDSNHLYVSLWDIMKFEKFSLDKIAINHNSIDILKNGYLILDFSDYSKNKIIYYNFVFKDLNNIQVDDYDKLLISLLKDYCETYIKMLTKILIKNDEKSNIFKSFRCAVIESAVSITDILFATTLHDFKIKDIILNDKLENFYESIPKINLSSTTTLKLNQMLYHMDNSIFKDTFSYTVKSTYDTEFNHYGIVKDNDKENLIIFINNWCEKYQLTNLLLDNLKVYLKGKKD